MTQDPSADPRPAGVEAGMQENVASIFTVREEPYPDFSSLFDPDDVFTVPAETATEVTPLLASEPGAVVTPLLALEPVAIAPPLAPTLEVPPSPTAANPDWADGTPQVSRLIPLTESDYSRQTSPTRTQGDSGAHFRSPPSHGVRTTLPVGQSRKRKTGGSKQVNPLVPYPVLPHVRRTTTPPSFGEGVKINGPELRAAALASLPKFVLREWDYGLPCPSEACLAKGVNLYSPSQLLDHAFDKHLPYEWVIRCPVEGCDLTMPLGRLREISKHVIAAHPSVSPRLEALRAFAGPKQKKISPWIPPPQGVINAARWRATSLPGRQDKIQAARGGQTAADGQLAAALALVMDRPTPRQTQPGGPRGPTPPSQRAIAIAADRWKNAARNAAETRRQLAAANLRAERSEAHAQGLQAQLQRRDTRQGGRGQADPHVIALPDGPLTLDNATDIVRRVMARLQPEDAAALADEAIQLAVDRAH